QQACHGGATALRRTPFSLAAGRGAGAAGTARGTAIDPGRRARDYGPALSDPGAQPRGCVDSAYRVDPRPGRAADATPTDPADARLQGAPPGGQAAPRRHQGVAEWEAGGGVIECERRKLNHCLSEISPIPIQGPIDPRPNLPSQLDAWKGGHCA